MQAMRPNNFVFIRTPSTDTHSCCYFETYKCLGYIRKHAIPLRLTHNHRSATTIKSTAQRI